MLKKVARILEMKVCDACLGRQFAKLLTGYTNEERGKILRNALAFELDNKSIDHSKIDMSNFHNIKFRENKELEHKDGFSCDICGGFFQHGIEKYAKEALKKLEGIEFNTFLVGSRPSKKMLDQEEKIWKVGGIDTVEPMKAEINREVGKILEKMLKKKADLKKPDVVITLDLEKDKVELTINPVYIFGYYQKMKRGIPQSRWGTPGKYKTSVQEEIGKPFLKFAVDHKFHGAGREDIDALCLAYRPFVLELVQTKKRKLDLKKITKEINKSKIVKVSELKISDMEVVRKVKAARGDKTYRALIKVDKPLAKEDLTELKKLVGASINQRTPTRVVHRRADLMRERKVKSISTKYKDKKTFELVVKGGAGLYIKELISGDNGRTKPSVSEILGRKAVCKELDVIKIEKDI